tara:strand:+ start:4926 stop:6020 length:1095 start_codon:yes stop_codon:yes gene_type:complete
MRSNKVVLFGLLVLFGCGSQKNKISRGYDATAVLLHLNTTKQSDSIGFNLVQSIPELLYPRLLTGDLALWENSQKRLIVGSKQLQLLEKKAMMPFVRSNDLFIHEYWNLSQKNFDFIVQGFTFTGKNKNGQTLTYGYVDAVDIINLMKSEYIPTNANGPGLVTYWDALHTKDFNFNLVQFGSNNFKTNPQLSFKLQYQAIKDPKVFRKFHTSENTKTITYRALSPLINSNSENKSLYSAIEKAVNNNKQAILNAGGDNHFSHIIFAPWKVEQITVKEKWSKYKNIHFQELISVELFIDKHAITLTKKQLEEINTTINLQGLEEYLSEKRFSFMLEEINNQEIQPQQSEKYYQALLTKNWNKITL